MQCSSVNVALVNRMKVSESHRWNHRWFSKNLKSTFLDLRAEIWKELQGDAELTFPYIYRERLTKSSNNSKGRDSFERVSFSTRSSTVHRHFQGEARQTPTCRQWLSLHTNWRQSDQSIDPLSQRRPGRVVGKEPHPYDRGSVICVNAYAVKDAQPDWHNPNWLNLSE